MAPATSSSAVTPPLADWFFICGVDGDQLHWPAEDDWALPTSPISPTIEEDKLAEGSGDEPQMSLETPRQAQRNSQQRGSRISDEVRASLQTIKIVNEKGTESNRSSTTIKATGSNGLMPPIPSGGFNDDDFECALRRFASERDTFLTDLSLSAGVVTRPKPRPKTQRIVGEEAAGLKSSVGSIRRRISMRDMSSVKRQPSALARNPSIRTSRRMSNYNSVIPNPQPLNSEPNMHPLKQRFEPVLLDRYPQKTMKEEIQRRAPFPDYVPMFAFPNDVNIVSSDERPRSTWHGFAMTTADNSRLYGICILIWMPLNQQASAELEKKCDQWRKKNMSPEERELASSLGERLVIERATLSRLLAKLPTITPDSRERQALEDEIGAVEEKIGLMTDLLRPMRHGAASKIDGLTEGETGFWVPRAYGILGRQASQTSFWKEWLRAVTVPMMNNAILRIPPSSPKIGVWQPLERYVVNLCTEAMSPITSKTQVEISVRELHLYSRREALNEIPGSRNTDLYALFKALSIPNIMILFEYLLSEARIILISSHTSMLHLVCSALVELLYPLTWSGVYIPILPARLVQAIEAPCPYIVGLERRYENVDLPTDDFVLVDLEKDLIESTYSPPAIPKQQRRKLMSLLQVAAPHHYRFGVIPGPPGYGVESFPFDSFASENPSVFASNPTSTLLSKYAGLNSSSFGDNNSGFAPRKPVLNAFLQARETKSRDRPGTNSSHSSPPGSLSSPVSGSFSSLSRNDSSNALQATLREKRSGHFDSFSRRSSSFNMERSPPLRRPSIPFSPPGHGSQPSVSTIATDGVGSNYAPSLYAPSSYAQSTLAASTIMPNVLMQSVRDTDKTKWVEGHCFNWRSKEDGNCAVCDEKPEEGIYCCTGCGTLVHGRCAPQVVVVCSAAFHPEQIRAAFVRCFASLLFTYRKFLRPATNVQKKSGQLFAFDHTGFTKSLPKEVAVYIEMLRQTQAFNVFINEREVKSASDPSITLFDQIIGAKKNRGRASFFGKATTTFLSDTSEHLWRTASINSPSSKMIPDNYRAIVTRTPAKLDPALMKEPRIISGVPRLDNSNGQARRKPIRSMLGSNGLAMSPP